jgi:hypothetical protein
MCSYDKFVLPDMGFDWAINAGAQEWAMVHEAVEAMGAVDDMERGFVKSWELTSKVQLLLARLLHTHLLTTIAYASTHSH